MSIWWIIAYTLVIGTAGLVFFLLVVIYLDGSRKVREAEKKSDKEMVRRLKKKHGIKLSKEEKEEVKSETMATLLEYSSKNKAK